MRPVTTLIRSLLALALLFAPSGVRGPLLFGQSTPPEKYRRYALTHDGDVARGAKLFNDEQRALCSKCHSVDGTASKAGPDLFAAGDAFGRRDLIEAILQPSATIAPGYGNTIVDTKTKGAFQGVLKQSADAGLQLMGMDGKLVSIAADEIKAKTGTAVSLMPEGLQASLTVQEFTDLIEYLTTLKQPASTLISDQGMPTEITMLTTPVAVRPFFTESFVLPRTKAETGLTSFRQIPGSSEGFLVLHQKGMVWRAEKTEKSEHRSVFLDLTAEVFSDRGPNGLLDVAFHPKFRTNRKYYLFYQVFEDAKVTTHIVEREFSHDFRADSAKPGRLLLKIASVAEDHSGGCLQFGPDGFLYIVMGDTGPHHDPNGHAQNMRLLLGKLLRIDVNPAEDGRPYTIPDDNPFCREKEIRPEIWASGLRNPWRFSFDRLTGDLWLADVGQDRVDEIDIIHRGENHGWNVYEGFERFSNQFRKEGRTYAKPVFAYRRKYGNSVTGGHVYRGDKTSTFYGVYIFGDYNSKRILGITQDGGMLKLARQIGSLPQRLVSFAEDEAGEIYAVGYEGMIYRIDFRPARFE